MTVNSQSTNPREHVVCSLVIPVYNEQERITATLIEVFEYLGSRPESWELIVVDDGSTDQTVDIVKQACSRISSFRLLRNEKNSGKGFSVRRGLLTATGDLLFFSDADLSSPISELTRLLEPLCEDADIVIGSRALRPEWISPSQSALRQAAGRSFNRVLRLITGLPFRDTQCGFKGFRRAAARAILPLLTISGYAFDVELLYLARKFGYRSLEVPVHWGHMGGSKVRVLRDGIGMLTDLLRIRWNDRRSCYTSSPDGTQPTTR
jgi:glycosyltransferase involved in cell wall biosynthesis